MIAQMGAGDQSRGVGANLLFWSFPTKIENSPKIEKSGLRAESVGL